MTDNINNLSCKLFRHYSDFLKERSDTAYLSLLSKWDRFFEPDPEIIIIAEQALNEQGK